MVMAVPDYLAPCLGMNTVALPQEFEEGLEDGLGKISQALVSANELGKSHV
jgi:hypothetical protein